MGANFSDSEFKGYVQTRVSQANTFEDLKEIVQRILSKLGISGFYFSTKPDFNSPNTPDFTWCNLPDDHALTYATLNKSMGPTACDLLLEHAYEKNQDIFGSVIYDFVKETPSQAACFSFTRKIQELDLDTGINDSLIIAIHPPIASSAYSYRRDAAAFAVFNIGETAKDFHNLANDRLSKLRILGHSFYIHGFHRLKSSQGGNSTISVISELTKRELYILKLFFDHGIQVKKVAKILNLSPRTVEKHAENIRLKLNVNSTNDAITLAVKQRAITF